MRSRILAAIVMFYEGVTLSIPCSKQIFPAKVTVWLGPIVTHGLSKIVYKKQTGGWYGEGASEMGCFLSRQTVGERWAEHYALQRQLAGKPLHMVSAFSIVSASPQPVDGRFWDQRQWYHSSFDSRHQVFTWG